MHKIARLLSTVFLALLYSVSKSWPTLSTQHEFCFWPSESSAAFFKLVFLHNQWTSRMLTLPLQMSSSLLKTKIAVSLVPQVAEKIPWYENSTPVTGLEALHNSFLFPGTSVKLPLSGSKMHVLSGSFCSQFRILVILKSMLISTSVTSSTLQFIIHSCYMKQVSQAAEENTGCHHRSSGREFIISQSLNWRIKSNLSQIYFSFCGAVLSALFICLWGVW